MKKVYLSGKISGIDIRIAKHNFYFSEKEVIKYHGAEIVVNPFNIKPFLGLRYWIFFMIADIWQQRKCTHSAFRYDWKDSRGAVIEYFFAKFIFKHEIIYLQKKLKPYTI